MINPTKEQFYKFLKIDPFRKYLTNHAYFGPVNEWLTKEHNSVIEVYTNIIYIGVLARINLNEINHKWLQEFTLTVDKKYNIVVLGKDCIKILNEIWDAEDAEDMLFEAEETIPDPIETPIVKVHKRKPRLKKLHSNDLVVSSLEVISSLEDFSNPLQEIKNLLTKK